MPAVHRTQLTVEPPTTRGAVRALPLQLPSLRRLRLRAAENPIEVLLCVAVERRPTRLTLEHRVARTGQGLPRLEASGAEKAVREHHRPRQPHRSRHTRVARARRGNDEEEWKAKRNLRSTVCFIVVFRYDYVLYLMGIRNCLTAQTL